MTLQNKGLNNFIRHLEKKNWNDTTQWAYETKTIIQEG